MTRRKFVPAAAALAAASGKGAAAAESSARPHFYEMTTYHLRNTPDNQRQRTIDLIEKTIQPALSRAGAAKSACFSSSIGPGTPYIVTLTPYPSMASIEETRSHLNGDDAYNAQMTAFASAKGLGFTRVETALLRAFPTMPSMIGPTPRKSGSHIFELRTYESDNAVTLARKIKMFEQGGEIAIFRKNGMEPVFFAETVYGPNMPNLVYMLAFDDLASRENNWKAFASDPAWAKLRSTAGNGDAEIVSNISNVILTPLPFSSVK